jgi:hypothetical protein
VMLFVAFGTTSWAVETGNNGFSGVNAMAGEGEGVGVMF